MKRDGKCKKNNKAKLMQAVNFAKIETMNFKAYLLISPI